MKCSLKAGTINRKRQSHIATNHAKLNAQPQMMRHRGIPARAEASCQGYQTLINNALREYLASTSKPVDSKTVRRILCEELNKAK
jgi:hypothetical protein